MNLKSLKISRGLFTALAALALASPAAPQANAPLHVEEVLESVRKNYPPLLEAFQEGVLADAVMLVAEGRFDLQLFARTDSDAVGRYANRRFETFVEQPTATAGLSFFGGYRVSAGEFAPYDGKLDTRPLGEVSAGLRLPLLRNRAIDLRRAELAKAHIEQEVANLSIEEQKLVILEAAALGYWNWVAAGRQLGVTEAVLDIAQRRQDFLEASAEAGQIPPIEATDNLRAILERQAVLVDATRAFEKTSIDLSLYYRNTLGEPVIPAIARVPERFPESDELLDDRVRADIAQALERRPDLRRIGALTQQLELDAQLARNQRSPALDFLTEAVSEAGPGATRRGPQQLRAALVFEFPWQNRMATGRLVETEARIQQIGLRQRFARDQVRAQVLDAASAVRAAYRRLEALIEQVRVSEELEDAERLRFELGEGTLFILNLREQQTADAALREVSARADYQRARVFYQFATAYWLGW